MKCDAAKDTPRQRRFAKSQRVSRAGQSPYRAEAVKAAMNRTKEVRAVARITARKPASPVPSVINNAPHIVATTTVDQPTIGQPASRNPVLRFAIVCSASPMLPHDRRLIDRLNPLASKSFSTFVLVDSPA